MQTFTSIHARLRLCGTGFNECPIEFNALVSDCPCSPFAGSECSEYQVQSEQVEGGLRLFMPVCTIKNLKYEAQRLGSLPGGRRPRQKRHRRSGSDIDGCKWQWNIGEMLHWGCIDYIAVALSHRLATAGLELGVYYLQIPARTVRYLLF